MVRALNQAQGSLLYHKIKPHNNNQKKMTFPILFAACQIFKPTISKIHRAPQTTKHSQNQDKSLFDSVGGQWFVNVLHINKKQWERGTAYGS